MRIFKALFVGVLALAAFAMAASTASAATATPSTTAISGVSANTLTFTGGGLTITCPFTLNGSLPSSISSTVLTDVTIGAVTSGAPGTPCTGASALAFLGLDPRATPPTSWTIRATIVLNADGTIDTSVIFKNAQFLLTVPIAGSCLYAGDVTATKRFPVGTNPLTLAQLDFSQQEVPKVSGGILCPSRGGLNGAVDLQPDLSITLRL